MSQTRHNAQHGPHEPKPTPGTLNSKSLDPKSSSPNQTLHRNLLKIRFEVSLTHQTDLQILNPKHIMSSFLHYSPFLGPQRIARRPLEKGPELKGTLT